MNMAQQTPKVFLSKEVLDYFKQDLNSKPDAIGVRIGVEKKGCSGYVHILEYAYEQGEHDLLLENNGLTIVADKTDFMKYLQGVKLVYKDDGINAGIEFENPNSSGECGCGESFTVK